MTLAAGSGSRDGGPWRAAGIHVERSWVVAAIAWPLWMWGSNIH